MIHNYNIISNWKGSQLVNLSETSELPYNLKYKSDCDDIEYTKIKQGVLKKGGCIELAIKGDGNYIITIPNCDDSCFCERKFSSFSDILKVLVPQLSNTICGNSCEGCNDFLDDTSAMANLVKLHTFFNFSTCAYARSGRVIANMFNCTMLAMLDTVKCESQFTGKEEWTDIIDNIISLQYLALYFTDKNRVESSKSTIEEVDAFYNIKEVRKCLTTKGMNVPKIEQEFNTLTANCMEGNCTDGFASWVSENIELFNTIVKNYIEGNPSMILSVLNQYIENNNNELTQSFVESILNEIINQAGNTNSEIYNKFLEILNSFYNNTDGEAVENLLQNILNAIVREINNTTIEGNGPITELFETIIKQVLGNNDDLLCEFIENCSTSSGLRIIPSIRTLDTSCSIRGEFVVQAPANTTQEITFLKDGPGNTVLNVNGTNKSVTTMGQVWSISIPSNGEAVISYSISSSGLPETSITDLRYLTKGAGKIVSIDTLLCQDCAGVVVNIPPTAGMVITPNTGDTRQAFQYNGGNSSDPDGNIVSYNWNFGDGNTASGITTSNIYAAAGTYNVSLTVTDNDGATHTTVKTITVAQTVIINRPPTITIAYSDGTTVPKTCTTESCAFNFIATANDPENATLVYTWEYGEVVNNAVQTWTNISASTSNFRFSTGINGRYRIRATVTDGTNSPVISNTIDTIRNVATNPKPIVRRLAQAVNDCASCYRLQISVPAGWGDKRISFTKTGTGGRAETGSYVGDCVQNQSDILVFGNFSMVLLAGETKTFVLGINGVEDPNVNAFSTTITVRMTDINTQDSEIIETLTRQHSNISC